MAGIAGISTKDSEEQVTHMLGKIQHRGDEGAKILTNDNVTLAGVWSEAEMTPTASQYQRRAVWDGHGFIMPSQAELKQAMAPFALAMATPTGVVLARDVMGIKPLYYGKTQNDALCFASEVKALLPLTTEIRAFPPGSWYEPQKGLQSYAKLSLNKPLRKSAESIIAGLRERLEDAVKLCINNLVMGSWLSGGLDSSAMAALARSHVRELHTFAAGLPNAPDLDYARQVAKFIKSHHHEVIVNLDDLLAVLPDVIYHLESFDALLVRSTLSNYLVAQRAADYVGASFSGEGADELFAGYAYLKDLPSEKLDGELLDITKRLHNTALQRVDRSASAHSLVIHVPFLNADVVDYALRIPTSLKLRRQQDKTVEKWVLRQALADILPEQVVWRKKAKFWEGAGIEDLLSDYADAQISDRAFEQERELPNGWHLNTKEELLYYRLFREQFGALENLSWMGRTKGAPKQ